MTAAYVIDDRAEPDRAPATWIASVQALTGRLRGIGDGLSTQFDELARDPNPAACEALAANLSRARRHLQKLRSAILAEGGR